LKSREQGGEKKQGRGIGVPSSNIPITNKQINKEHL